MSLSISVSQTDLSIISKKRRTERNAKFLRRYQCLWMLHESYLKKDIAHTLGVSIDTITDWIKIYNKGGLEALGLLHYEGRRPSSLDPIQSSIQTLIETEAISTIAVLGQRIKEKFNLEVEHSWLYRYCKKNSVALIKKLD